MSDTTLPVVIVGAGLAGLCTALHLADQRRVVVLAKRSLQEGATAWAQGGVVGVLGADDSVDAHVHDTQVAGAGLVPTDPPSPPNAASLRHWRLAAVLRSVLTRSASSSCGCGPP